MDGPTCIMVVCSLIHWWSEEASSLNWSNFFCASASKRGWPGGGSGNRKVRSRLGGGEEEDIR